MGAEMVAVWLARIALAIAEQAVTKHVDYHKMSRELEEQRLRDRFAKK